MNKIKGEKMKRCTGCEQEAEKTSKINFLMLDGTEVEVNICAKCANKIDENLFYIIVCRICQSAIWVENIEKEKVSIKVQEECARCAAPPRGAHFFPMV